MAVNGVGGLEVFVGEQTVVTHIWQSSPGSTWSEWDSLGDPLNFQGGGIVQPAAILNPQTNNLEVFLVGSDVNLYHASLAPGGEWNGWESFGDPSNGFFSSQLTLGAPSLATDFDGRIWAFLRVRDGKCYYTPNLPPPPPPPPPRLLRLVVHPTPTPLGVPISLQIEAFDQSTGQAVTGTVSLTYGDQDMPKHLSFPTGTAQSITLDTWLKVHVDGKGHVTETTEYPAGTVTASPYAAAEIPFGFK